MNRLAFAQADVDQVAREFSAVAPLESGVFFEVRAATTQSGIRLVAAKPYFPAPGEWEAQHPHSLTPTAQLLSAMVSKANRGGAGLLFVHSHPDSRYPTAMSPTDMSALSALAPTIGELLDGPFAAAVVGPDGWAALVWSSDGWQSIERISSSGRGLKFLEPAHEEKFSEFDDRQQLALGEVHDRLSRCDLTIVGTGGIGSPLAETVVRMGVRGVTLVDPDFLDTPSNVRRVFGAKVGQLAGNPELKADVVARHCQAIGLPTKIRAVPRDVRVAETLGDVLDADAVLCGTDSHSSRATLSAVAYAFHLPLIDCGVRIGRGPQGLEGLPVEVRTCGPGLPCLWCRGTLSSDRIREENLPEEQRTLLAKEGYLVGSPGPAPSVAASTVVAAGLVGCALLGMLDDGAERLPAGYLIDGLFGDGFAQNAAIQPQCICGKQSGLALDAMLGLL